MTINRPNWNNYFMGIAHEVSKRSHDSQTKVGCIIVNNSDEIVTTGYNGFIRGVKDNVLPNTRPDKYPWMIHSEHNAIISAARQGKSTLNCTAYITGMPCFYCIQYMYQSGINGVVYDSNGQIKMCESFKMQNLTIDLLKLIEGFFIESLDFSREN
jgi:dCMP deaminase